MRKKSVEEMKASINKLTFQLNKLKKHADESESSSKMYNKMLIQRAIYRKRCKKNNSWSLLNFIIKKLQKKKSPKLISDYFKN